MYLEWLCHVIGRMDFPDFISYKYEHRLSSDHSRSKSEAFEKDTMMSSLRIIVLFGAIVAFVSTYIEAQDDCLTKRYLADPRRDPSNPLRNQDSALCDISVEQGADIWYRFDNGVGGSKIPESCVDILHCGTYAPIWMSGSHPTADQPGPVTRTVCAQFWPGSSSCCDWSSQVVVKWCRNATTQQQYHVYKLSPPPACPMAYCAFTTPTPTPTPPPGGCIGDCARNDVTAGCSCPSHPIMTNPVLSDPYISDTKQVIGVDGRSFIATKFSLRCSVGYPIQTRDDGARFRVNVYADGSIQLAATVTVNSTNPVAVLGESDVSGKLGKSFTCTVSSYWQSSSPVQSTVLTSNDVFLGFIPVDQSGNQINRINITEGQTYSFRMKSTFPITSPECFDNPSDPCVANYTFSIAKNDQIQMEDCSFYFTPLKNISGLITIRPVHTIGTRTPSFIWQLDFNEQQNYANTVYNGYKIRSVPVKIDDPWPRAMCSSTGDPHITTFATFNKPGKNINVYALGDFVLVNSSQRVFEIQVRQFPCNGDAVTCNCGVMIREGNNILGIDSCPRSTNTDDWTPWIIQSLTDGVTHGGIISQTGSGWTINLISGVQVNVDRGWTRGVLDVHVIGLTLESSSYNGLCTYNGDLSTLYTADCVNYKVQASFFEFRLDNYTRCNTSYSAPTCDCKGRNSDGSISIGCIDNETIINHDIIGPFKECKISNTRKKRSTEVLLKTSISFDSLYNSYYPTLTMNPDRSLKENDRTVAIRKCTDALRQSPIYPTCSELQHFDATNLIENCATDYQYFADPSVPNAITIQLERLCVHTILRSVNESSSGPDPATEALYRKLQEVNAKICPLQCSQRGICINGSCQCYSGFIGSDCSLRQGQAPSIVKVLSSPCDLNKQSCQSITSQAVNVSFSTLSCKIRNTRGGAWYDFQPSGTGGIVICNPATSLAVDTYYISLSNDRSTYGSEYGFSICDSSRGSCDAPTTTPTSTSTTTTTTTTTTRAPSTSTTSSTSTTTTTTRVPSTSTTTTTTTTTPSTTTSTFIRQTPRPTTTLPTRRTTRVRSSTTIPS